MPYSAELIVLGTLDPALCDAFYTLGLTPKVAPTVQDATEACASPLARSVIVEAGGSGPDVVQSLRNSCPGPIPILAIAGQPDSSSVLALYAAGANSVLTSDPDAGARLAQLTEALRYWARINRYSAASVGDAP